MRDTKTILLTALFGLVIACCQGTSAYATLATGTYVSSDSPSASVDSHTGEDAWDVDLLGSGAGASDGHDTSTANLLPGDSTPSLPSRGIDDGDGSSWRITADGFSAISATATFAAPLAESDFVSLDFDLGNLGSFGSVQVRFLSDTGILQASLFAVAGSTDFMFFDAAGPSPTGIALSDDGFNLHLVKTSGDTFGLTVKDLETTTSTALSGTVAGATGTSISAIEIFNFAAGPHAEHSVYFNSLQLDILSTSAVPEPSAMLAIPFALAVSGTLSRRRRRNALKS